MPRTRLFAATVLLSIAICSYLALEPPASCCFAEKKTYTRITVDEAEKLVQDWVKKNRDQCYWHDQPKLKELTTEEIWQQLHTQVFKMAVYTESAAEVDAYLVKDGKAYPMSTGFGGHGLTDMCACDIDKDSNDELVYVYSWGSGLHRSLVNAYRFDRAVPVRVFSAFAITNVDIKLKKQSNHKIDVWTLDGKSRFGELVYRQQVSQQSLSIAYDPTLPKELKDYIWESDGLLQ